MTPDWLVLVPSRRELAAAFPELVDAAAGPVRWAMECGGDVRVAACGVGPVAAAARAGLLLTRERPVRAALLGLAGTLDPDEAPVGSVLAASRIELDGVGVGAGPRHLRLEAAGVGLAPEAQDASGAIACSAVTLPPAVRSGVLVTVVAAAADPEEARARRRRFPEALAEDMESWSVAKAASLAAVPLIVLRGVANVAGDREPGTWSFEGPMRSARETLEALLRAPPR